jgi:hypothetical protein
VIEIKNGREKRTNKEKDIERKNGRDKKTNKEKETVIDRS